MSDEQISLETFTIRGHRNGSLVHVTWTNGVLRGDPPTVDAIEVEAEISTLGANDRLARRTAATAGRDPLANVLSAALLVYQVVDRVSEVVPVELATLLQAEAKARH